MGKNKAYPLWGLYSISAQNGYGKSSCSCQHPGESPTYILHKDNTEHARTILFVKLRINNHIIVGLVHKKHTSSGPLDNKPVFRFFCISHSYLRLFTNVFFCCSPEVLEQSSKPTSLLSPPKDKHLHSRRAQGVGRAQRKTPETSDPDWFWRNGFYHGSRGVSENRPKPSFLPRRPPQH